MRILVTGGTGLIGSHTVEAVAAAGHEIRLLARDPAKVERTFGPRGVAIADVVEGDVTDPAVVEKALTGCDGVIHAAAVVSLQSQRAREVLDTNRRAVELVIGGASERELQAIVYVSSVSALFHPGPPITVDSPLNEGVSAYQRSKTQAERFVRDLQDRGAPIRTTYPPGVIGPDDPGLSEGNHMLRAFLKDSMVDTSSGVSVLDVRDLARIHARLVELPPGAGRYVIPGHYLPWPDAIALLDDITGRRVNRVPVPGALLRFLGSVGDLVKRVWPFDYPLTREAMEFASLWPDAIASPDLEALGLEFRSARQAYTDASRWLYESGHLTSAQVGKLATEPAG